MRLLVTGGAGFIGSHFVKRQVPREKWQSVTVLDSLTYAGNRANLMAVEGDSKFSFVHGDICDPIIVDELIRNSDVVVNFAAESHVDRSLLHGDKFVMTNVVGTTNLLKYSLAHKIKVFHQVSTDEVYGSILEGSWDENYPLSPNSPYSASKAAADLIVLSFFKSYGLDVRISRCSNNYGPNQFPEKLIPLAITNLMQGAKIPVYGDGQNRRDWLHVEDHCLAIEMILNSGQAGEVYNVGGGVELSNLEVVDSILKCLGKNVDSIEFVSDRQGHDFRYSVNWEKLAHQTNFRPLKTFSEGIWETVNWYTQNSNWWMPLTTKKYG
jgi:dTDP-glucose 4,6-dehydratase